jgi:hypothetical protein
LGKGVLREAASLFRYKCGYVDEKGHAWVIRPQLDECRSFSENRNLAAVLVGSSWGFIDTSGVLRISAEYDDAGDFAEGLAPVKSSWFRGWGYINEEGRIVIPYRYKGAFSFDNGKAFVMEGGKKLYINNAGEVIEELKPAF